MEVEYGYDEFQPDMALGLPEDLMRAQQHNISADLRCANSNNERPDWRARGIADPWYINPKFHDPSMQDRVERGMLYPRGCRLRVDELDAAFRGEPRKPSESVSGGSGGNSKKDGDKLSKESYSIKESCVASIEEMDMGSILILIFFVVLIYLIMGCRATIRKLKKEIKNLKKSKISQNE